MKDSAAAGAVSTWVKTAGEIYADFILEKHTLAWRWRFLATKLDNKATMMRQSVNPIQAPAGQSNDQNQPTSWISLNISVWKI